MGIPSAIYQAVSPVFASYGVPDYVWQSIADMETGGSFDPKSVGDGGRSFGLFQLFTAGGQGDSYASNPDVLFDPQLNAEVAAPAIAAAYHVGRQLGMDDGPDLAAYVATNSGHPNATEAGKAAVEMVRTRAQTWFTAGSTQQPATVEPKTFSEKFNAFMYGRHADGSPKTWSEYWGSWGTSPSARAGQADTYVPDQSTKPIDPKAITQGAKDAVSGVAKAMFSDTLGDPLWWKKAGLVITVVVVALILLAFSVSGILRPEESKT